MAITTHVSGPSAATSTTGPPAAVAAPLYSSHATGTITLTFLPGTNGSAVKYAIYFEERNEAGILVHEGYLDHDGSDGGASPDLLWHLATEYDADSTTTVYVTATGLTTYNQYKFRVDSQNEDASLTATGTLSAPMVSLIDITRGPETSAYSYEVTTGNTKVSNVTVTGTSSVVTIGFTTTNKTAETSSVLIEFSKDGASYTEANTKVTGAVTGLTAAAIGSAHTVTFATCTHMGNSYSGSLYIKVTPYDAAGSGTTQAGDAGTALVSSAASIDNRPLATTLAELDGYTWDKDTTPEFIGTMASVVCGTRLYFVLTVKDSSGVILQENSSATSIGGATDGWFYEADFAGNPGVWTKVTTYGVLATYATGGNRWKYVCETALAASQTVSVTVQQAEITNIV